jgi:glycolate oxidase FAD binding subunit
MHPFTPAKPAEVAEAVSEAAAKRIGLSITGLGSKKALGRPAAHTGTLDLSALSGTTLYEPEELVLSALAGTPVDAISATLAERGQELAFEPLSFAALYGTGPGTLGGSLMTNLSGPRRIKAGAVRDFILGIKAVTGRGEVFKAGGRVVKNVTGYDLSRGLAGSFGTLAVATEITLKVLPRAETAATLLLAGLDPAKAVEALCAAMGSPCDVSGAAHLPPFAARKQGFSGPVTALRIEGFAPSVKKRLEILEAQFKTIAPMARLGAEETEAMWRAIRDAVPLAEPRERLIWRISAAPSAGPLIAGAVLRVHQAEALFDWSGGLIWLAIDPCADAGAALIRQAVVQAGGGHATLIRAPAELRAEIPVFEPLPRGVLALSRRLKEAFDPCGIMEPGRMRAEF